ncbi:unnamed protein product [Triticum turgidum subsp. durum]|uniref:Uncharacterized protein n=1 Tax=Triticum turgidum subsp. durum TaxID=4567 RepID=A0A9R0XXG7_TRITD|nr:unnamed protein product [Triticum turgidum subsp. durum]
MGMGGRGVVGDRWSQRVLWMCAIGSAVSKHLNQTLNYGAPLHSVSASSWLFRAAIRSDGCRSAGLYFVAVERQAQNRARAVSEGFKGLDGADGGGSRGGEDV